MELVVLLALVFIAAGAIAGNKVMLLAGFALACLGGLEVSIREHFAGFRSHTTLLSATAAFAAVSAVVLASGRGGVTYALLVPLAAVVFGGSFWALRELFRRRSGGLSFR